ncbi:sensor histidine kinase [Geopsychrobacter electrodiphilus]|uniref:sensor histidine kinase n=1 Tax=Geopsychrobacter electrodiphilus TaxID=225196 RepID=UPI000381BC92|nr:HAMP domain-containing sensor histidine kinase [Geopsychrobacter electrodiphilus]
MIRTRLIIASWLLLLVPALLLGVGAWRLLQNENTRLNQRERQSAAVRLNTVASNLELAIAEVEDGLMQRLKTFAGGDLPQLLSDWREENPLVRNVFIWQPGTGLIFPDRKRPASDEERLFIRRYLPLFSGEIAWQPPPADQMPARLNASPSPTDSVINERKELRLLASKAPTSSESVATADLAAPTGKTLWRSWYADDQLHLLGWYQPAGGGLRYGIELEMMALLSRLLSTLSPPPGSHEALALIDGNGHIFHQSGAFEITDQAPEFSHSIAGLPHWQLGFFTNPDQRQADSGFLLIGSLLAGSFIAAILLGGSLLLWQSLRHQRDARQKTSFVSNVSHELKTPLTTIRMYAELLEEGKIESAQKQRGYLQTIIRESQRLTRLVNNILDFSRLEQGHKDYNLSDFDLIALLDEILDRQSLRLKEAGLVLTRQIDLDSVLICSDRDAIEQILLNLIDNAIKYAASGKQLTLEVTRTKTQVNISLTDHGPGIPSAQRQKIFAKFHRLDSSLTSSQPGAGLGLSIAQQLARGMGGDLSCNPGPTGGTCFCLTLPLLRGRT